MAKGITEGKVKSQIKVYTGEEPKTQAPPPPKPPKFNKEMVNGPAYYGGVDNPYEVIKVCEAWGLDKDAYLFNVAKYIARAGKKDPQKELEDLKKAVFYLERKIKNLQNESN